MAGGDPADRPERRRGIRLTVAAVAAFVAVVVGGFIYATLRQEPSLEALRESGVYVFENPRKLPQFSLVDDRGEPVDPESFEGQWSLVFFGFTHCPDVCPTTMATLNRFYRTLAPEQQRDTRVVLTTVDPARDTVEKLHQYVQYFHPGFRGVTGEFLEIHRFATGLSIPFSRVPGGGENYQVEHSGNIVIINPRGHYVGFFKAPIEVEKLEKLYPAVRRLRS